MQITTPAFSENARKALDDAPLQQSLKMLENGFQAARTRAANDLGEFDTLRDLGRDIKDHALAHLDLYLEVFEQRFTEAGGQIHWAADAAEANKIVLELCREAGARTVTKSKSMVAEEIGLNDVLDSSEIERVETDLGEHIIQLADEPPSHIIVPAIHKSKDQISDLFEKHHGRPRQERSDALVAEAREVLRERFLAADVGITGANFLVAETGSVVLVTNEGNAELTFGLPKTQIVVTGIEKVVANFGDAFTLLRLLARSATGQEFAAYTTVLTGPKRADDLDGPEALHLVLVDNGRSNMLGTDFQDMLRCIRCGACMNHCPVYMAAGGHAYGWVYAGPMGSVLTPHFIGIEKGHALPNASTFCGRCEQVCPVRIPLPRMMRKWREIQFNKNLVSATARWGLAAWSFVARRPALYRRLTDITSRLLALMGGRRGRFRRLPLAGGWTGSRDFPAPQSGGTFVTRWHRQRSADR